MGNKNTGPPKGPDTGTAPREEGGTTDVALGSGPRGGPPAPSPELLTSLQSLGEHNDYTLLPQSLHQIAEAYSMEQDYQWAVQFLQLERLYHERLLSNLAALQENWESQWRERQSRESDLPAQTNSIGQEYIETLSLICRTHQRPSLSVEKSMADAAPKDIQSTRGQRDENDTSPSHHGKVNSSQESNQDDHMGEDQHMGHEEEEGVEEEEEEEEEGEGEEEEEEGQEVEEEELCEEIPGETLDDEEVLKVEWPTGVPQASAKDLAKLSHTEGSSSPDGLVSILKRRRASLDGLPPPGPPDTKNNPKRKVRFREPEDGIEQDEVGGDSCLILLLLCLVTVVISVGGTALYCTLVDTYSNICTDFSHNVDFYAVSVRRFFDELRHWLPLRT